MGTKDLSEEIGCNDLEKDICFVRKLRQEDIT
jgi:hypothetical protein